MREDADREARATVVVAVRTFGDVEELLLAGGGQNYRLEKPDQISVRLKIEHSGFGTIDNRRFFSKFVEDFANLSDSKLMWMTQYCILCISGK